MAEPGIGRASAFLASGTIVSRVLGFVKAIILAQTLGVASSKAADAFAVANQLPNNLYVIIAGGVLSAVLVPQIVRAAIHPDGGRGYINKLLTIALLVLGVATLLAMLIAPLLVWIYASSWSDDQRALATAFAYWCLPQIFFYGLYTVLGEILNARKSFGPFTWAPVLNNVVAIIGLVVFISLFGAASQNGPTPVGQWTTGMIALLGGSATLGVAVQALILFLFWKRIGLSYRPDFRWRGVGLRAAGRMAGWTFGMLLLTQLAGVVETNVAGFATGSASVFTLQNAWLIFMLPHSIITVSIATAYFTRMSEKAHAGDLSTLREDVSAAIRVVSLLIVLAATVLLVVAGPFAGLFARSAAESGAMASIISAFVWGLVPFCILFVIQRAFYALGDTRTPFFFTLVQTVLFTIGAIAVGVFFPKDIIAFGIAMVVTVSGTLQTVLAAILLRRRIGGLDLRRVIPSLLRYTAAAAPALVVGTVTLQALSAGSGAVGSIIEMIVVGVVMALVYAVLLVLFRAPELSAALQPIATRFRRSR